VYSDTVLYVKTESAGPPKRLTREEQRERTRAALCDAAARVFVERSFTGASVEAIAAEAGYTRGAFYANFDSKEELFAELLQRRVYSHYRRTAEQSADPETRLSMRELGERLAEMQRHPDGAWLFRLWLEALAHADRNDRLREIAAGFWSENRRLAARVIEAVYAEAGRSPTLAPDALASALIAMDIGLAIQHLVDPEAVPLDVYPEVFEAVFGPLQPE
jgi:AcrR family transcriptional regulator